MPIALVAGLLIAVGGLGLLNDLLPLVTSDAAVELAKLRADGWSDLAPAWGLRALAIVGGVGLMRGRNWARWLVVAWMVVHLGISAFHSIDEVFVHLGIFVPITVILFRSRAAAYFDETDDGAV
jgi:hypothetical protein